MEKEVEPLIMMESVNLSVFSNIKDILANLGA